MKARLIQIIVPVIAAALAVVGYAQFTGIEGIAFKFDVAYSGDMVSLWATLDAFPDGTVVIITFRADGMTIPNVPKMQLMAGSDAAFDIGDSLPLHKTGGMWVEMTRYFR